MPIPRSAATVLAAALLSVSSCAIVDSVASGFRSVGRFANGIARGKGEVVDGKQQGDWQYLSENGRIRAQGRYEDDEQVGLWTYFYESGQKEYEGVLENERRVGRYQYWHPNGNPRAVGSFVDGREFGTWTFWGTRGNIVQRGPFLNGLREGRWTSFHPDGTLAAEGLYREGRQVGRWRLRTTDGTESVAWTSMPDHVEWMEDRWDDGAMRREGFRALGRASGLWTLRHENGDPRLVGTFENGVPHGHWAAYGAGQQRIGEGQVSLGRAVGLWTVQRGGSPTDVDASGFSPSMPFGGTWSTADLAARQGVEGALSVWLSEAAAPLDDALVVDMSEPEDADAADPEASAEALAAADVEPDVPVMAQPWTEFELTNFDLLVEVYKKGGAALQELRSRYARVRGPSTGGLALPEPGGDVEVANGFVGRPLALTVFKTAEGTEYDLAEMRGNKVVVVVLRGYPGKVCVYCTAQTQALYEGGAIDAFEELGAKLHVVFPGEKNGLEAFRAAYDSLSEAQIPPYGILYENDYILGPMLDLEGSKIIPSTFILDEEGIVRFAYIGKTNEDRPSVALLVDELKKLADRP
ncbi:MAG: redoxin domain-containing protein [Planctomycetota bacterium]